ncbi:MAG TPA: gamma-glutamyltransferase [Stellaceae bacterium]|nr:gamma-glutamyltransferase [Stellaceae bacterium]
MRLHRLLALITLGTFMASPALAQQDRSQARSMVISEGGIVAAEQPLAAQIGAAVLASGGNAVDAAVATNAAMGVLVPMSNGIGGDLFAIVYEAKSGKLYGVNASGWAPKNLTPEHLAEKGATKMPGRGIDSVTVPGTVAGWDMLLARFGRKTLKEALSPSIALAERGFPVTEFVHDLWAASEKTLAADPDAAHLYLPEGHAPAVGEIFRNPDLAQSYREIAIGGRNAFYKGPIAVQIVAASKAHGGTMTLADLAQYDAEWATPLSINYRGWTVYEMPPNGQGIAALEMLNIMETFPLSDWGHNSAKSLHAMIEAKKLAYADMIRFDADPHFAKMPLMRLLSKNFAQERAKAIDPAHAACNVGPATELAGADTIYLSVVDRDGNMVSLIQSNFASVGFGSGVVAAGAGFALQNRGGLFSLDPKSPNLLAGHKRPVHTIIPAFMEKGDQRIAFGIMGGWNQSQAHAQFVSNVVDFHMNIQAALEAARFSKDTFQGCDVQIEDRVPAEVREQLTTLGHEIQLRGDFAPAATGGGQAMLRDFATGVNYGASDPRKDGEAVPQPPVLKTVSEGAAPAPQSAPHRRRSPAQAPAD